MKTYKTLILLLDLQCLIPSTISVHSYSSIYGSDSTKWEIPFCNLDHVIIEEQIAITHPCLGNIQISYAVN